MSDFSLGGLATGMDTTSIINQLMQLEAIPKQNLERDKVNLQEQKDAWRDVNSRVSALEDKITQLKLSSTFNSNSTSSSNSDVVTASATSSANEGSYNVVVKSVAKTHRLGGDIKVNDTEDTLLNQLSLSNISGDITFNGGTDKEATITVDNTDTLETLMDKINNAEAGISSTIVDGHLVLESNDTGADNAITINDGTAEGLMNNLGILEVDGTTIDPTAELQAAQDATVEINGITDITRSTNTIDNAVEGVTFTIASDASVDDTATISVSKDTGKATKAVQAFVDQYNSLNDFIDTKTSYDPDTGRSGVLNGDSTLSRLQSNIRTMFTDGVNSGSSYDNMYSVGISIDRDGVMSFDSGELEDALNDSPADVMNLFKAEASDEGFDGVATRLDGYLDQLIQSNTGTIPNRLDYFDNEIERVEDDIADIERSMEMTRERYIEQFSSMEEAISEMQSQQSWMMSQLSSMGSGSTISSML